MAGTPVEEYFPTPEPVLKATCSWCGKQTDTQAYILTLERPQITREWVFCTLKDLRKWAQSNGV